MHKDKVIALTQELINIPSVTPNDHCCQDILITRLKALDFVIHDYSHQGIRNTWAVRGDTGPLFVFSGHTDVVPPGDLALWTTPPFEAHIRDGILYGRGASDMKGALAAMIIATEQFLEKNPNPNFRIAFMITSDEEGDAEYGTRHIIEKLMEQNEKIDWCLIGEASSQTTLGDVIKVGRRGSLHGLLKVIGKQGHIAYPQLAENPIHHCFSALDALTQHTWDKGNEYFTPTSFQIYNINADTGASNIIPGSLTARFNFRYAPTSTAKSLKEGVEAVFRKYDLHYEIDWQLCGEPFLSPEGSLREACREAINSVCGIETEANTTGGTSDGRFIAKTGCEIVELGLPSHSIHQVNECAKIEELYTIFRLYKKIFQNIQACILSD